MALKSDKKLSNRGSDNGATGRSVETTKSNRKSEKRSGNEAPTKTKADRMFERAWKDTYEKRDRRAG